MQIPNSSAMKSFVSCARVLAHKALIINDFMSGAPSHEIKGEPQSGDGCEADAFMNVRAELLAFLESKYPRHNPPPAAGRR